MPRGSLLQAPRVQFKPIPRFATEGPLCACTSGGLLAEGDVICLASSARSVLLGNIDTMENTNIQLLLVAGVARPCRR